MGPKFPKYEIFLQRFTFSKPLLCLIFHTVILCVKVVSIVSLWYVAIDQRLDIHFHFWKFSWKLATFSLPLHWEISFSSSFLSWNTIETRKMGQFESWLFQRNRLLEVCGGPRTLGPRTLGPPMLGPRTLSPGTLGPRMLGPLCH